jgi:aminomethyltransferase
LVVNASTQDKDFAWLQKNSGDFDVTLVMESDQTGQIAIQGPLAEKVLQRMTDTDLSQIAYYHFTQTQVKGIPALVSRTGYTGEDGFECYVPADRTAELWNAMLAEGKPEEIKPCGLGARDTLRLESRMHLYGQDMDETTTVLEAGLGWVTKFKKAADFIGKEALLAQKKAKPDRKLIGFELTDRGIARHDYEVVDGDRVIGRVTSGTQGPTLKKSIGLAYVESASAKVGNTIHIKIRNKTAAAVIVKGPFYKRT